jgi:hypothetical protein
MPINLSQESGGKILTIQVTGKLVKGDYAHFVAEFDGLLREHGTLRVLFDMQGLEGWDAGAAWEDLKFDVKHFSDIERLAMVGEKKWQQAMALIFERFTKAKTRYFDRTEGAAAREWLTEP